MSGIVERLRANADDYTGELQCESADTIEELASGFSLSIMLLERIGGIAPSEWAMTEAWKAAIAKVTAVREGE